MTAARVGFRSRGRDVTPDAPCMFDNYCNVEDFENWLRHTQQWMYAVLNRSKTGAQLKAMRPMVKRLASLEATGRKGIIERLKLTGPTKMLVDMALDLQNVARTLGPPVTAKEVTPDLSPPILELPVPDDVLDVVGPGWSFDKFVDDITATATGMIGKVEDFIGGKYLGWALMAGILLYALSEGRRGR